MAVSYTHLDVYKRQVLHGDSVQEDGLVRAGLHALVLLDDLVVHGTVSYTHL